MIDLLRKSMLASAVVPPHLTVTQKAAAFLDHLRRRAAMTKAAAASPRNGGDLMESPMRPIRTGYNKKGVRCHSWIPSSPRLQILPGNAYTLV